MRTNIDTNKGRNRQAYIGPLAPLRIAMCVNIRACCVRVCPRCISLCVHAYCCAVTSAVSPANREKTAAEHRQLCQLCGRAPAGPLTCGPTPTLLLGHLCCVAHSRPCTGVECTCMTRHVNCTTATMHGIRPRGTATLEQDVHFKVRGPRHSVLAGDPCCQHNPDERS